MKPGSFESKIYLRTPWRRMRRGHTGNRVPVPKAWLRARVSQRYRLRPYHYRLNPSRFRTKIDGWFVQRARRHFPGHNWSIMKSKYEEEYIGCSVCGQSYYKEVKTHDEIMMDKALR